MFCFYENKQIDLSNTPLSHIGIHVENFEEALALAIEGKFIQEKWGIKNYEKSRSFYIADPNGLEIEISEKFAGGH